MASNADDEDEFSGTDGDDGLEADIEALRKACILTGANLDDLQASSAADANAITVPGDATSDSDEEDDLELVRRIQERFSAPTDNDVPLYMKPICSLPPIASDEDEDDFEVLRAIKRRFGHYDNGTLKHSTQDNIHKLEQGHCTSIASEKEPSYNFSVDQTNSVEGFPDHVDYWETTQTLQPFSENFSEIQHSGCIEWHQSGGHNLAMLPHRGSGFPKSAQMFIDAIKKNRSCQKFIRNKMIQIEAKIEENKKLKDRVKILKDFQISCKKRTGRALSQKKDARVQLIAVPKQRANSKVNEKRTPAVYYGPAENSHVSSYRMAMKTYALSISREKWSREEKENLAKGVKQQFQKSLVEQSFDLFSGIEDFSEGSNDVDSIVASVRDLDIHPENIRLFLPKVNWDQLASMYVVDRSGGECEARWLNCEDPLINHHPWTKMEDKNLLSIIQQKGIDNWIDIAVSLGTHRTPFQCLARYQRSLNAMILKREWTEAEDDQLRAAVETYGESNWQLVASTLEGRTGTQCSNRWKKSLHPARQRVGKWTQDEDKRLKVAVMLFGPKTWKKIAQFVPGRTEVQCRERWVNCLDPALNMNKWTEEEDSRLEAAIAEHGYCWSKVAACVPPRTDNQCRRRWKVLFPHEVPLLQAAKKTQKAALISNFVDRESERPALGPNDFIPLQLTNSISEHERVNPSAKRKRKSRKQLESKGKDAASDDIPTIRLKRQNPQTCSEEVPMSSNCNDDKFCMGDDISKKKRVRKSCLKSKKCTGTNEDHSSTCPGTRLLMITSGEDTGATGGDIGTNKKRNASGRQKRKSGESPEPDKLETVTGNVAISKRRRLMNPLTENKDGGTGQPLSCLDSNLLIISNGEEVLESNEANAIKNRRASKLHPRKNKCIELPKEVPGMANSAEAVAFSESDTISKKKSGVTKPHLKKNGATSTVDHSLSGPDSTLLVLGSCKSSKQWPKNHKCIHPLEENRGRPHLDKVEVFGGSCTLYKRKRMVTEPQSETNGDTHLIGDHLLSCMDSTVTPGSGKAGQMFGRHENNCTELPEKMNGINNFNGVKTCGGGDNSPDNIVRPIESHSKDYECTDPTQNHSPFYQDSASYTVNSGNQVEVFKGHGVTKKKTARNLHSKKRVYMKLLQELSEMNDSDETDAFSVAFPKKVTEQRLEKNKCIKATGHSLSSFENPASVATTSVDAEAVGGNVATLKKKADNPCPKPCSSNQFTEPFNVGQSSSLFVSPIVRTVDGTLCEEDRIPNQHSRMMKQAGEPHDDVTSSVKIAESHSRQSGSIGIVESSQNMSCTPPCSTSSVKDDGNSKASSVLQRDRPRILGKKDKTCSNQILETGDGDDMILSFFLRGKSKKC